ncbi:hypothetical protein BN7_1685 [Wickerhamomyces ciferrii]|uniref:F-box domain-containing protein n=1 Tax=Wickerhamomyces ciferrii (strain ATCC 14091 / BCRC 22168 / CBS 111 / JCM 3599 / NBRC 0793 / NRRL Y-1031 F-60-10) TaxID=1206466 RepID=K0KAW4_WICCF|nr:uncharacterized protein BN7_1685 [Wickerhamomyces ciferrii]CCH42140.1 hypothetical protein BN7_1685 [Wickerhamomyces ciferrii]
MTESLFELPDEVLVNVLIHLSPYDIKNLFSIRTIAQRFGSFLTLYKDRKKAQFFTNVPSKSECQVKNRQNFTHGLMKLFEITTMENLGRHREIGLPIGFNEVPKFYVYSRSPEIPIDKWKKFLEDKMQNITFFPTKPNYILVDSVETIFVRKQNISNPSALYLPRIKNVFFLDCQLLDQFEKFNFKKLSLLNIEIRGEKDLQILKAFDFDQCSIDQMCIFPNWNNIDIHIITSEI